MLRTLDARLTRAPDSPPRWAATPLRNGQPEESLSCHQPASIPIRPRRGRTSQTPQPPCAEIADRQPRELVAPGFQLHPSSSSRARRSCSARSAARRRSSCRRPARRSRDALELAEVEQATERRLAPRTRRRAPARRCAGSPSATIAESSRSSLAICPRSERLAARSLGPRPSRGPPRSRSMASCSDWVTPTSSSLAPEEPILPVRASAPIDGSARAAQRLLERRAAASTAPPRRTARARPPT